MVGTLRIDRYLPHATVWMMPPSARNAAPLVTAASCDETYTTMLAISSTVAKRCSSEVGRTCLKNSDDASSTDCLFCLARSLTKVSTPSDSVGPGNTEM